MYSGEGQASGQDGLLDGVEFPGVILTFHINTHAFPVVVLFALDERFGRVLGEVGIDVLPFLFPVVADRKLTTWGCGRILGLGYAVSPRLARYSRGLSEPREILMRFSLYQQM